MSERQRKSLADVLRNLGVGEFTTLATSLKHGGSLQARKLSNGTTAFYWRFSLNGKTSREPVGIYDPKAPPKKLEPTTAGFSLTAALHRCEQLGALHREWGHKGGLKAAQADERRKEEERKALERARHEAEKAEEEQKSAQTLEALLLAYVDYLKAQGRSSYSDAANIFKNHVLAPWPAIAKQLACEITAEHIIDMQRRLIDAGKGRTSNKLRSYLSSAFQCAVKVHRRANIPALFKQFKVTTNPVSQTERESSFDRADKRPLKEQEMRSYWRLIADLPGLPGAALKLHLLTGGQRIEQLLRLKWADVEENSVTLYDGKGRPGRPPRRHMVPLLPKAQVVINALPRESEFVFSAGKRKSPLNARTLSQWAQDVAGNAIEDFQLKRVRSGVETMLAARRIDKDIRAHLQSHGLAGVQARHYDDHHYLPEKTHALQTLLRLLESQPEINILKFPRTDEA